MLEAWSDSMTPNEKIGTAVGAGAIAYGLKQVYAQRRLDVSTPVWLGVTAGLTWLGWLGYSKLAK
jgi:hypothetical protein